MRSRSEVPVPFTTTPLKIASLLPAATEIACALGARDELVARSHECDYPAGLAGVPVVTRTRLGALPRSADIDRDLRRLVEQALAIYELDVEALRRAAPDVILTQDLCDVCAVPFESVRAAACEVLPAAVLVRLSPLRLADVWNDIRRTGAAIGRDAQAARVAAELEARLERIRERVPAGAERPRVLTIEWIEPVMIGATWMPDLIEIAGGTALVARAGEHAPTLRRDELRELRPDVVLIKPCGFELARTRAEAPTLAALLDGLAWPALRDGRVWLADGNAYFNRPGPRLVESCEILAACLHPGVYTDFAARHARSCERFDLRRI